MSFNKVDFPLPETPVMQTNFPSGISTLTSFKLFSVAPMICNFLPLPGRRRFGIEISSLPLQYFPVMAT